ncbi:MAG: PAS domain S-box protein [Flavobacteriales bacterium]|nr:PAS domain S-box protein [Flavobacteriales bacterium]
MKTSKKSKLPPSGQKDLWLNLAFEDCEDALLLMDPKTLAVWHANGAAIRLFGYKDLTKLTRSKGIPRIGKSANEEFAKSATQEVNKKKFFKTTYGFKLPGKGKTWIMTVVNAIGKPKNRQWLIRMSNITKHIHEAESRKKEEDRWTLILKNLNETFLIIDKDCVIKDIHNPSPHFRREEVIGKKTYSFTDPAYVEPTKKHTAEIFRTGKSVSFETAVKKPDGSGKLLWYQSILIPNLISKGKMKNVISISRNITEQKEAEEARIRAEKMEEINLELQREIEERIRVEQELADSRNYIENMVNSSADAIVALDENRNITKFNRRAEEVFGYSEKEILGKHISLLSAKKPTVNHVGTELRKNKFAQFEIVGKRKNGEEFPLFISTSMLLDAKGNRLGSVTVARDVTEEKRKEKELRASEKKYRDLVENSQIIILTHDMKGVIRSVNAVAATWIGYGSEELIGKKAATFIASVYRKEFNDYLKILRKEKFARGVVRVVNQKNQEIFWSYKSSLRRNEKGYFATVYLEDITEQVHAEKQIKESLREKEVLLREVHHRVKNNLQVISSILNLQSSYVEDPKTLNILRESQNRIKSMAYIHESLYQAKNLSHINFAEYIQSLSDNLFRSYGVVGSSIEIGQQIGDVFLNLDTAIPCGLIVHELLSNSLKYAFQGKAGGKIDIKMQIQGDEAVLTVEDNGKGLPKGLEIEKTRSLGLQLVVALVEQLGGKLTWSSSPKGSRFKIVFQHQMKQTDS